MENKGFFSKSWNVYSIITSIIGIIVIFIPTFATKNFDFNIKLPIAAWLTLSYFLIISVIFNIIFIIKSYNFKLKIVNIEIIDKMPAISYKSDNKTRFILYKINIVIKNNSNDDIYITDYSIKNIPDNCKINSNNIVPKDSITKLYIEPILPAYMKNTMITLYSYEHLPKSYPLKLDTSS